MEIQSLLNDPEYCHPEPGGQKLIYRINDIQAAVDIAAHVMRKNAQNKVKNEPQQKADGGTLYIPEAAFNFAGQLPREWQSRIREEYYRYEEHRDIAQEHLHALAQLGIQLQMEMAKAFPARAESIGPVMLNPACGGDALLFGLSAITDIIGIDLQPFGPPASIISPQHTVNPEKKARYYGIGPIQWERSWLCLKQAILLSKGSL
jgi:hypothetical protein